MLTNSKFALFDDSHKMKLENPDLSLDAWMGFIDDKKCTFRLEKVQSGKGALGGKKYAYRITTQDPIWPDVPPATRSRADFHLLYLQLTKRFANAVVPKLLKAEVDNLHLMEMYLTEISLNPYFRMDITFSDFLNGKLKEFKHTKKNDRKHSQGTLRWLQQTTEYPDFDVNDAFVKSLKGDIDQMERIDKSLMKSVHSQMKSLAEMQDASNTLADGLGTYMAHEQVSIGKTNGSCSGLPQGMLGQRVSEFIELNADHMKGLRECFDSGTLERLSINPFIIELKLMHGLRRVLDIMNAAFQDFEKSRIQYEGIPSEDVNKRKVGEHLAQKEVYLWKQKRALGYELERYRTYRTVRFQTVMNDYLKFQLRGAARSTEVWGSKGIRLDPTEEMHFLQNERVYNEKMANLPGRGRSNSLNASKKILNAGTDLKSLMVVKSYSSMMSGKYLKITKGDLLTGFQLPSGDWQATNSVGSKGMVKSAHVELHNPGAMHAQAGPGPGAGFQPASRVPYGVPGGPSADDDEEWSLSGDEDDDRSKGPPSGMPYGISAPQPPVMPPGLLNPPTPPHENPAPMPPQSKPAPMPPQSKPAPMPPAYQPPDSGFARPQPPSSKPVLGAPGGFAMGQPPMAQPPMAPQFGMGQPNGGGMGMPTQPKVPQFGQPGPAPVATGFNAPGVQPTAPSFGPPGGGSARAAPPMAAPKKTTPPKAAPKKSAAPKKGPKKKLGGAMPAGPGGGGRPANPMAMALLKDINKGPKAVKLNKVEDPDKVREAKVGPVGGGGGGARGGGGGGGGARPPPAGGGGGMLGEMAAKLNKRRAALG